MIGLPSRRRGGGKDKGRKKIKRMSAPMTERRYAEQRGTAGGWAMASPITSMPLHLAESPCCGDQPGKTSDTIKCRRRVALRRDGRG